MTCTPREINLMRRRRIYYQNNFKVNIISI